MKNWISAAIIALGLFALGLSIRSGITSTDRNRVVAVRGLCEREVQANKVTWPLTYNLVGNDLPSLYDQMEVTNKIVVDYLVSNGLNNDEICIGAPSLSDAGANQYNREKYSNRYLLTSTVTVTSEQVDLVRKLINRQGELMKKGISIVEESWNNRTIYEYTDLNVIKPEMIAEATKNAREAANKFAEDSGSKIGQIKDAQQGQFSIEDRDPYTPFIKNVRVVTYINYYLEN